jgi:hypothetical protein
MDRDDRLSIDFEYLFAALHTTQRKPRGFYSHAAHAV